MTYIFYIVTIFSILISASSTKAACPDVAYACIHPDGSPAGAVYIMNRRGRGIFGMDCTLCRRDECSQTLEKFQNYCKRLGAYLPIRPNSWLKDEELLMTYQSVKEVYDHPKDVWGRVMLKPIPLNPEKRLPQHPTGIIQPTDPMGPPSPAERVQLP